MTDLVALLMKLPGFARYKPLLRLRYDDGHTLDYVTVANQGSTIMQVESIRRILENGRVETCTYGLGNGWITQPVTIASYTSSKFTVRLGLEYYQTKSHFGYLVSLTDGTIFFINYNISYVKGLSISARAIWSQITRARYTF